VEVEEAETLVPIDPRYVEVCEPNSLEASGLPDNPVLVGLRVIGGNTIRVRMEPDPEYPVVRIVISLTGVRKGFQGKRFPNRTRAQFEANERFIRSAYPGA